MKVWKLVAGIISIVLFVVVVVQSCAAGVANSIYGNGESSGTAGMIVSVLLLAGGIVSIATRNAKGNGGNIALIVLFGLGALIGISQSGTIFKDLIIWGIWCAVNAVIAIVAMVQTKSVKPDNE